MTDNNRLLRFVSLGGQAAFADKELQLRRPGGRHAGKHHEGHHEDHRDVHKLRDHILPTVSHGQPRRMCIMCSAMCISPFTGIFTGITAFRTAPRVRCPEISCRAGSGSAGSETVKEPQQRDSGLLSGSGKLGSV